jgi:hypothetical protein
MSFGQFFQKGTPIFQEIMLPSLHLGMSLSTSLVKIASLHLGNNSFH